MSRPRSLLFGTALAIGCITSGGAAFAADDGYANVFSSVLGAVGLSPGERAPEIDYRERAPLVLPPKMNLVKPVAGGANRTAAWPQDPDVQRRRREAEEARAPFFHDSQHDGSQQLSRDELMRGRVAGRDGANIPEISRRQSECGQAGNQRNCLVLNPDELKAMGDRYQASGQADKKEIVAGEEPDRMYLTQPPKGYMKSTKTIKATADAPVQKLDASNPKSQLVYTDHSDD